MNYIPEPLTEDNYPIHGERPVFKTPWWARFTYFISSRRARWGFRLLQRALQKDADFALVWKANIALQLYHGTELLDMVAADRLARTIMSHIFDVPNRGIDQLIPTYVPVEWSDMSQNQLDDIRLCKVCGWMQTSICHNQSKVKQWATPDLCYRCLYK